MRRPSGTPLPDEYDGAREFVRQAFVTGAAVTLPVIVTLLVLSAVVNFVSTQLNPVVGLLTSLTGVRPASELTIKLIAILALLAAVFCIGAVAERRPEQSGFGALFDTLISRIPGVGSLYQSLDEMSGLLLDSDTDSFREVKLVEFPDQGAYAFAFLTADTPDVVQEATGHDNMVTLFLPLAPNPVMGGYVLHVSEERVFDVDMTVEEGIQSIVTSGVATGRRSDEEFTEGMLDRFERRLDAADIIDIDELETYAVDASSQLEARARETMAAARSRAAAETDGEREGRDGTDSDTGATDRDDGDASADTAGQE